MRGWAMIALAALAMGACGKDAEADNVAVIGGNAAVDDFSSNDTTAIDAVTGEDANMAADVELTANDLEEMNSAGNQANAVANNAE